MIGIDARIEAHSAFRSNLEGALERKAIRQIRALLAIRKRVRTHRWRSGQWLWPDL